MTVPQKIEKFKKLKAGKYKSFMANHLWWRMCERVPAEDIAELKEHLTQGMDLKIEDMMRYLKRFGFDSEYVAYHLKSLISEEARRVITK